MNTCSDLIYGDYIGQISGNQVLLHLLCWPSCVSLNRTCYVIQVQISVDENTSNMLACNVSFLYSEERSAVDYWSMHVAQRICLYDKEREKLLIKLEAKYSRISQ